MLAYKKEAATMETLKLIFNKTTTAMLIRTLHLLRAKETKEVQEQKNKGMQEKTKE